MSAQFGIQVELVHFYWQVLAHCIAPLSVRRVAAAEIYNYLKPVVRSESRMSRSQRRPQLLYENVYPAAGKGVYC